MNKFSGPDCSQYKFVKWQLRGMVDHASRILRRRQECKLGGSLSSTDSSAIMRNIDQKAFQAQLPVAAGAFYNSQAEARLPTCLENTHVQLIRQIMTWVDDPVAKGMWWLNDMAGTGKSTIS